MNEKKDKKSLNNDLKRLSEIAQWFNGQEEIDVEEGLQKVKEAAGIIKESKGRLKNIENEFQEIKKEIEEEIGGDDKNEAE